MDPVNVLIAGIYYVITGLLTLFSIFAVYILIRYAKSTLLGFSVSVFYVFIYLVILNGSYQTLQSLLH